MDGEVAGSGEPAVPVAVEAERAGAESGAGAAGPQGAVVGGLDTEQPKVGEDRLGMRVRVRDREGLHGDARLRRRPRAARTVGLGTEPGVGTGQRALPD